MKIYYIILLLTLIVLSSCVSLPQTGGPECSVDSDCVENYADDFICDANGDCSQCPAVQCTAPPTGCWYEQDNSARCPTCGELKCNTPEPTPTCNDKKQNGNEEGIDCGGICPACNPTTINDDFYAQPKEGTYNDIVHVFLESSIPGADIYYTLDGSIPTTSSSLYFDAIEIRDTSTLKAIAVLPGSNQKEELIGSYNIIKSPSIINVNGNTFFEAEATKDFQNYVARPDFTASNGEYMLVLDQQYSEPTYLAYDFSAQPGEYYFWVRCIDENSWGMIYLDINGVLSPDIHCGLEDGNVNGWGMHWMPVGSGFELSGTEHNLKVNKRIFTSKIDRLLITSDPNYVPPELVLIRPAGGEVLLPGSQEEIKWETTGTVNNIKIEYSSNDGKTWQTIIASTPNDGSHIWTTPSITSSSLRVKISDVTDSYSKDISDFTFRIQQNKQWDTSTKTFRSRLSAQYNKHFDPLKYENDREEWLNKLEAMGEEQQDLAWRFDGLKRAEYNPYNIYYDVEAMNRYRLKNDDKTILIQYGDLFCVNSLFNGEGWHIPPTFDSWTNNYPDEWILKDDKGNIVYNERNYGIKDIPECDYCKQTGKNCEDCKVRANFFFAHSDYVQDAIVMIDDMLNFGYDGAFFDSFSSLTINNFENGNLKYADGSTMKIIDPRTGQLYESWTWVSDIRNSMYSIRKGVDRLQANKEAYFIINGLNTGNLMQLQGIIQGALKEGYCSVADGRELSDYYYEAQVCEKDINAGILAEDMGVMPIYNVGSIPGQTDDQAAYYSLATALLSIKGPDTNFYMDGYSIKGLYAWPGFDLPLSMFIPEGRYEERSDNVLVREFQKARVYVNPTKSDKNINFGGSFYYLTDDGHKSSSTLSSITLKPNHAIILYK